VTDETVQWTRTLVPAGVTVTRCGHFAPAVRQGCWRAWPGELGDGRGHDRA
jgi:hypothetical protein